MLVAPGMGNGSYDYRSNILVLPLRPARTVLETVAYALALYRKDVDHTENDGRLWKSFYHPDVWRRVKTRAMPKGVRKQVAEFVRNYVRWTTRESQGHAVLDDSVRVWFEEFIAPDWRGPQVPPGLRALPRLEIEALREAMGELPPRDQLMIKARFYEGMSAKEISQFMALPSQFYVRRCIRAALAEIRTKLEANGVADPRP